jgi:NlpC/P60 family putative phage cell wall peptidase
MNATVVAREGIVAAARGWIGTPYRHQASLKGTGCDCLGLVRGIWREVIGPEPEFMPPYTPDWAEAGLSETLALAAGRHLIAIEPGEAQAGDVLLFRWRIGLPAKHCAILGSGSTGGDNATIIHAHDGASVAEVPLGRWWARHVSHAFAFPHPSPPTGA